MDADMKRRIQETAVKILQAAKEMQTHSDVDSQKAGDFMMTEDGLCATVSGSLGLDLSCSDFQLLVCNVLRSNDQPNQAEGDEEDADFAKLLAEELEKQSAIDSADDIFARRGHRLICREDEEDMDFASDEELEKQSAIDSADHIFARRGHRLICRGDEEDGDFAKLLEEELEKESAIDSEEDLFARRGHRLICRLAANKMVTVTKFEGQRMVSLRKWYPIKGKLKPCKAGIHLKVEEWTKLRDAMNDVDQVIATVQNAKPGGR